MSIRSRESLAEPECWFEKEIRSRIIEKIRIRERQNAIKTKYNQVKRAEKDKIINKKGEKKMDARLQQYEDKMKKTIEFLESDYSSIRAGRANPHVLDKLRVDYYGTPTPIQQVGNVTVPEARIIQIAPWDKSLIKAIEKAIMASDLGLNPSNDGNVIRLIFPELTEERRKDLVKDVRKKAEESKVAVRNIRRDGNDALKKLGKTDVSEDEIKQLEDQLQKATDKFIKEIDTLMEKKSKEIMTV